MRQHRFYVLFVFLVICKHFDFATITSFINVQKTYILVWKYSPISAGCEVIMPINILKVTAFLEAANVYNCRILDWMPVPFEIKLLSVKR